MEASDSGDSASKGLGIAALIVAALSLPLDLAGTLVGGTMASEIGQRRLLRASLAVLLMAGLAAGCGSGGGEMSDRAAPSAAQFPSAKGETLNSLLAKSDGQSPDAVAPTQEVYSKGRNRFGFGLFDRGGKQVTDGGDVALYAAHGASGKVEGPFPARVESLATEAAFTSETTAKDPAAAKAVYVVGDIPMNANGEWSLVALIKKGGNLTATRVPTAVVGHPAAGAKGAKSSRPPPSVGQPALRIHTPTAASVGGELAKITTRIPPDTMNRDDLYNVLGRKPVVLLFATPQFCQSRTCGPVVDEAEQVQQETGGKAAFIHVEIYNQNDPNKGVRPQVSAYRLPSEPWLFVIDRHGVIRTRIEGAFGISELKDAVDAAIARR